MLASLFLVSNLGASDSVSAANPENVTYQVNVAPSLVVEVPTGNNVVLDLNPNSKTFDYKDLEVIVRTNNVTGYQLKLTTADNNTYLTRDTSVDAIPINAQMNTLTPTTPATTGYSESDFKNCLDTNTSCMNKWGYKVTSSDTDPSLVTTNYFPFTNNTTLAINHIATNGDSTTMRFAAKINYNQIAGSYQNTLVFTAVATYAAYTINYYDGINNTSGNEIATQTNAYNTSATIPINPGVTPTRTTYSFLGWCDQIPTADANNYFPATVCPTGHSHQTGAILTIDPNQYSTDINLYAYWDPTTFDEAYQIAGKSKPSGSSYYSMQDMASSICANVTDRQTGTLRDVRDTKNYTVAKIGAYCSMTQNLNFTGTTINNTTTDINTTKSITWNDLTTASSNTGACYGGVVTSGGNKIGSGGGYTNFCYHNSGNTTTGVWYNYAAATAGNISGVSNTSAAQYSICPKNWTLPTYNDAAILAQENRFNPVAGGYYTSGVVGSTMNGYWWTSSAASSSPSTITSIYTDAPYFAWISTSPDSFYRNSNMRILGLFVRCIARN